VCVCLRLHVYVIT